MEIYRKPPPPPISGWDITGDGIQNISGTAEYLGGASGTLRAYQYLKLYDEDYPVKEGTVTISATGFKKDGTEVNLGSAVYDIGDNLIFPNSRDATWASFSNSGGDGLDDYLSGFVGDGNTFSFAKRTFAQAEGDGEFFKNTNALDIYFTIEVNNQINDSLDVDNSVLTDGHCLGNASNRPAAIGRITDDILMVGHYGNENFQLAGWCFFTGECFTDNNFSFSGGNASAGLYYLSVDHDNPNDTFPTVYTGQGRDWQMNRITGYDVDGFPQFSGNTDLNAYGGSPTTIIAQVFPHYVNDMPTIFGGITGYNSFIVGVNTGTYVTPDYLPTAMTTGVFAGLTTSWGLDVDVDNKEVYMVHLDSPSATKKLSKFTYTGGTGGTITDSANWTKFTMLDGLELFTGATDFSGTGDVASIQANFLSVHADFNDIVNGYPSIYLALFDKHIIQRVRANTASPASSSDFDVELLLGTFNTVGFVEGVGLDIQFNFPQNMYAHGKILYVCDRSNFRVRNINIDSTSPDYLKSETIIAGYNRDKF